VLRPKKVGILPVNDEEVGKTNEITTAIPLLDAIDIRGKDITADALLNNAKHHFMMAHLFREASAFFLIPGFAVASSLQGT
jgi:hypothetical protein